MIDELTLEKLLSKINEYNNSDLEIVKKAYDCASFWHKDQFRDSGEPYIMHPLNVAYILASMHLDVDTICAGLLHDVVEDTSCTLDEIENEFNPTIRLLVDGVTKISNIPFSTPKELNLANTRKIISSVIEDVRIVIIKLADRLHNMRTMDVKKPEKQMKKAYETMEIFVPLAYSLGQYEIKNELEDLSFKYLKPDDYKETLEMYQKVDRESRDALTTMLFTIKDILNKDGVNNNMKTRIKHIYGIYKMLNSGQKIYEIHDLLNLKIMLDNIPECYLTLGKVHKIYHPINNKFKDYICNPKTNLYQSLHTTVFAPDERLVQVQIRTNDMEKVACFGLPAYFAINNINNRETMQEKLKNDFQFYDNLKEINSYFSDNEKFVDEVKKELFTNMIYCYTPEGDVVELPDGATVVDFAYKIGNNVGNQIVNAKVNNKDVKLDTILKNNDIVYILTDSKAFPDKELEDSAYTTKAKRKIKDYNLAMEIIKGRN